MTERTVALVSQHLVKYPEMRIVDVYKLLYQACMGPEHALTDRKSVEVWLLEEWESVSADQDEGLFENITLFHPIFRVNLRPAKAREIPPIEILQAFINLGNEFPKNPELFRNVWDTISMRIRNESVAVKDPDILSEFNETIKTDNFPVLHHSREYAEAYKPAYRLVGSKF